MCLLPFFLLPSLWKKYSALSICTEFLLGSAFFSTHPRAIPVHSEEGSQSWLSPAGREVWVIPYCVISPWSCGSNFSSSFFPQRQFGLCRNATSLEAIGIWRFSWLREKSAQKERKFFSGLVELQWNESIWVPPSHVLVNTMFIHLT